jgi:hypothetical protein
MPEIATLDASALIGEIWGSNNELSRGEYIICYSIPILLRLTMLFTFTTSLLSVPGSVHNIRKQI